MAKRDYVPSTQAGFNSWQQTINEYVTNNGATWGIPAALITELNDSSIQFVLLYGKIDNKATRTQQQTEAFNHFRVSYTTFLRKMVQGYLVNNPVIPFDEKIAMNLNPRTGARSERPNITAYPQVSFKNMEGGFMRFDIKNSEDGRSARPDNSDGVELYIQLASEKPLANADEDGVVVAETLAPEMRIVQSSKARFTYEFGPEERGNSFTVYGRFYNNSDRSKDGPIGATVTGYIS